VLGMHTRALLSITLLAAASGAVAADGGTWDFWVRAQASVGQLGLNGDAKYALNGSGSPYSMSDVGLDSSATTPAFELGLGTPIFDFHAFVGYQAWKTDGSATLSEIIDFGGKSFSGDVSSKAEVKDLYGEVNWAPIALNLAGFSIGLAAHQLSLSNSLEMTGTSAKLDQSVVVPTLALRAYAAPLDMLEAEVVIHGLAVPLGDIEGSYVFAQAQVAYYPLEYVGVIGGWRTTMIDLSVKDGSKKAEANVSLSGPFLGLAAQF
jgi:hypothetical protein